jgi:hypothetical protein
VESALGGPKPAAKTSWQLPVTPKQPVVPLRKVRPATPVAPASDSPPSDPAPALVKVAEGVQPVVSNRLAKALEEMPELDAAATAAALRAAKEKAAQDQPWWVVLSARYTVRNFRDRIRQLQSWWRHWRTTSSLRVLLAFVVIYALLAVMRKPSEVVVEQSRRSQDIAFLQGFLKSYCAAGGKVLAARPFGGTELYPRGVVLQGDFLRAFNRTPVGSAFSFRVVPPGWDPLTGFYGGLPIYAGGTYFQLERKFNFSLFQGVYLIRKDSEQEGVMLLVRIEPAS